LKGSQDQIFPEKRVLRAEITGELVGIPKLCQEAGNNRQPALFRPPGPERAAPGGVWAESRECPR